MKIEVVSSQLMHKRGRAFSGEYESVYKAITELPLAHHGKDEVLKISGETTGKLKALRASIGSFFRVRKGFNFSLSMSLHQNGNGPVLFVEKIEPREPRRYRKVKVSDVQPLLDEH